MNLANLSIIQAMASWFVLLDEGAELIYKCIYIPDDVVDVLKKVDCYLYIVIYVMFCMYYIGMMFLIVDRFLVVYLHLRYPLYWNTCKTKCILTVTWISAIIICVSLCVSHGLGVFNYQAILTEIISPLFTVALLSLAVVVYVYLFRKYRKSRLRHVGNKSANRKESMYQTFRNSRFYLDFLLVISFVIFMVIPNTISLFHGWAGRQTTHEAKDANKVSYQLLFLINFILCIAMHADVRRFVSKLYRIWTSLDTIKRGSRNTSSSHRNDSQSVFV